MDDAHACSDNIRDACKIKIPREDAAYDLLLRLFCDDLEQQGEGSFADINNGQYDAILPVPYWSWIEKRAEVAAKASEMVRYELEKKDDETLAWVKELDLFVNTDEEIQQIITDILGAHPKLVQEGGQRSLGDPWVIALAKQHNCVVVTSESGGTDEKPKIPSVCRAMGIECISMLELIRRERWSF